MQGTVEVPVTALWATSASFNRHITVNASLIRASTRLLRAVSLIAIRNAVQRRTAAIQERCASKATAVPTPRAILSSLRPVQIPPDTPDRFHLPSLLRKDRLRRWFLE